MADDADRAAERIENVIMDGIAACRRSHGLIAVGACHYCGEDCHGLFCNKDCASDWEYEQARKRANGKL